MKMVLFEFIPGLRGPGFHFWLSPWFFLWVSLGLVATSCGDSVPDIDQQALVQVGMASFYGPGFDGNLTANGEIFDQEAMTAAHKHLPFDTRVRVHDVESGKSVVVRINDRGPFIPGRIIDLSQGAAVALGTFEKGIAEVTLTIEKSTNSDVDN